MGQQTRLGNERRIGDAPFRPPLCRGAVARRARVHLLLRRTPDGRTIETLVRRIAGGVNPRGLKQVGWKFPNARAAAQLRAAPESELAVAKRWMPGRANWGGEGDEAGIKLFVPRLMQLIF